MIAQRAVLLPLLVIGALLLVPACFAALLTAGSTNHTLSVSVNDTVNYVNDTVYFFADYGINGSSNTSVNCSINISLNVTNMSVLGTQYTFNRSFPANMSIPYQVACSIDSNTSINESGNISILVNLPPVLNLTQAIYNITDETPFAHAFSCSDPYNDTLTISKTGAAIGALVNQSSFAWTAHWWHVAAPAYPVSITCDDAVSTQTKTFNISVLPRNVSLIFNKPSPGSVISNMTMNVSCNTSDGYAVYRWSVIIEAGNGTNVTTINVTNQSSVNVAQNVTHNSSINVTCLLLHTPSSSAISVNHSFIVDLVPPVLSNLSSNATYTTATMRWVTDEPATSTVYYGKNDSAMTANMTSTTLTTSHAVTITGLAKNSFHSYFIQSCDAGALCTASFPQTVRTFDCHHVWECGSWSTCESDGTQTRTCSCACESACIGNNSESQICTYAPSSDQLPVIILDNQTYVQGTSVSKKFFSVKSITWDLPELDVLERISINLSQNVGEARIVIIQEPKKTQGFLTEHIIARYTLLTTNIEAAFSDAMLTFGLAQSYENDSILIYTRNANANWTLATYESHTRNETLGRVLTIGGPLARGYLIVKNITQPTDDVRAQAPEQDTKDPPPAELKKLKSGINIIIITLVILIGAVFIVLVHTFFSWRRHELNAARKDLLYERPGDKESLADFFRRRFR